MIITDKFVFLHYPKTGGLFVTETLKKLHSNLGYGLCEELMLPNLKRIHGAKVFNPHGTYEQIPEGHKGKPIISCIRNPFDRYVSIYEFRNWVRQHPEDLNRITKLFPSFPELSFKEYIDFINIFDIQSRACHDKLKIDIGFMTYAFIQFFFKSPETTLAGLDESYLDSDKYQRDMPSMTFLHTEDLNHELYRTLRGFGYKKKHIAFILDEGKVNVTSRRNAHKPWMEYFNKELCDQVRFKERFIFKLFPEYLG